MLLAPRLGWQQAGLEQGAMSPRCCPLSDVPVVSGTTGTAGSAPELVFSGLSLSLGRERIQRVCPLFCNSQAEENSPSHPCHPPRAWFCPSFRKSCIVWAPGDGRGPGQASEGLGALISGLFNICSSFGHPCVPARDFLAAQAGNLVGTFGGS